MEGEIDHYMSNENTPVHEPVSSHSTDDENDDRGLGRDDEATEDPTAPGENETKEVKIKKVIKRPQPKLDAVRLMGPRGIGTLVNTFKGVKFKGKGYEKDDLTLLMKRLEHWSHRLFPKYSFDDNIKQIEKLGLKKNVQVQLKRLRLDLYNGEQHDEVDDVRRGDEEELNGHDMENQVDVFDKLLGSAQSYDDEAHSINMNLVSNSQQSISNVSLPLIQNAQKKVLLPKERERMERNKLLAAEKRKQRMLDLTLLQSQTLENDGKLKNSRNLESRTETSLSIETDLNEACMPEIIAKLLSSSIERSQEIIETVPSVDTGSDYEKSAMSLTEILSAEVISPKNTLDFDKTNSDEDLCTEEEMLEALDQD